MSKLKKHSLKQEISNPNKVVNFMGGNSYNISPLETLKIVAMSSIFAEPSYYRNSEVSKSSSIYNKLGYDITDYLIFDKSIMSLSTEEVFLNSINNALDYDFKGTLDFAVELRNEFYMRLNPSVIFVTAMLHPLRVEFNQKNPSYMANIGKKIINIPSDVTNMFEFYMFKNGSKNNMPTALKKVFAKSLGEFSKYHISKYKSKSLIDIVRISHAHSETIDELMKTGTVVVNDNEKTWEQLRSSGMSWIDIMKTIKIPHMALLRNLRNIFEDNSDNKIDIKTMKEVLNQLEQGVKNGKQFPFRYYTAYSIINSSSVLFKKEILVSLENCMDLAMSNFPVLKGKTMSLSDNSGSSHGTFTSEYGSVTVSDIANLSSVMTAINSEEGYVGTFGDKLETQKIDKNKRVLEQHKNLKTKVGEGTENGIWLFFDKAIKEKEHWDNIFIYSDMQRGHGGLYGTNKNDYKDYTCRGNYIDVLKLVETYRKKVNPKVNVFSVQVRGYNNSLIPENIYRGAILSGWTGKEVLYASEIINFWDSKEKN